MPYSTAFSPSGQYQENGAAFSDGLSKSGRRVWARVLMVFAGRVVMCIVYRPAWFDLADEIVERIDAGFRALKQAALLKNLSYTISSHSFANILPGGTNGQGRPYTMAGEGKKSGKGEKVGINTLVGRIADGLKSLTDIGILDDLSGILKTLARNKDYIVTLVEKSHAFSIETNKVWIEHKGNIESLVTEGDRLLRAFSQDPETLAKNITGITSDMATVAGGLSILVNEANAFLPEVRKNLSEAGALAAEAGTVIPVAKELAEKSLAAVNQVNEILPELTAAARDASVMLKEGRELLPQVKALLEGVNALIREADGLVPKGQRIVDGLLRNLPKLDKVDQRSVKKFFHEDGIRVFMKKLPF